jgi:hypothetical protein
MVEYTCSLCAKVFKQKGHYDQHLKRKNPCQDKKTLDTIIEQKVGEQIQKLLHINEVILPVATDTSIAKADVKEEKKKKGQFYTTASTYILDGLSLPVKGLTHIIEPFAGQGDLLEWLNVMGNTVPVESYDIEPKKAGILERDTLMNPPNYKDAWILTNPPYLARNKCETKVIFDKYNTNDLYKCFILSVVQQEPCMGGIFIIPAGFFLSPRNMDVHCRHEFLSRYKLLKVKYFEETVFADTTTTVVAFSFEKSPTPLTEQTVEWISMPSKETRMFKMTANNDWIIGGDIYRLTTPPDIHIRRHVEGQILKEGEQRTFMTLNALDSGTKDGRICLEYREGYVYPAKDCSRTYATLCIIGRTLTAEEQKKLCLEFNRLVEAKREETWSLFLPQFRESKEYARKRIPFELAYMIICHLIQGL